MSAPVSLLVLALARAVILYDVARGAWHAVVERVL